MDGFEEKEAQKLLEIETEQNKMKEMGRQQIAAYEWTYGIRNI